MSEQCFSYVVLRCVPRVDRDEFLNVGVVLYVQQLRDLRAAVRIDEARLSSAFPRLDIGGLQAAARSAVLIARGDASVGSVARESTSKRFGLLAAPRSSVLQPGPIHSGLTRDAAATLDRLLEAYVG